MIYGIGTDIVAVSRLESALNRHGQRFAGRILADEEMVRFSEYAKPAQFLA
ncbi:MAG: 4'-phosphopantetheinyl transferase superfamily protein, partial [Gammaproteobacteria bacterium]